MRSEHQGDQHPSRASHAGRRTGNTDERAEAASCRRDSVVDRRSMPDRREGGGEAFRIEASGGPTGLERRRGPGRRLSDFTKKAEEGELTQEQFLFLMAVESFKRANHKQFPSWTDVLEVVRLLGYRKTAASEISLRNAEDWREAADAPSNVRPERWAQRERVDRERRDAA